MSSTYKTPNLNLHSWVRTDPVVCEDFNENFSKIDTAVGQMRASYGCCEVYTGYYTGTGTESITLTFPKLPLYIIFGRADWSSIWQGFVGHGRRIYVYSNSDAVMSVSGNTVTWTQHGERQIFNDLNQPFQYLAFASATM